MNLKKPKKHHPVTPSQRWAVKSAKAFRSRASVTRRGRRRSFTGVLVGLTRVLICIRDEHPRGDVALPSSAESGKLGSDASLLCRLSGHQLGATAPARRGPGAIVVQPADRAADVTRSAGSGGAGASLILLHRPGC